MIWQNLLYGLIIGLGFIIPGVSGGILATILGIYEIIVDKILNLGQDFKNSFKYLAPLIIGIILSVLFFSKVILYFLKNHSNFISYVFIGLILGSVPYLIKEIKNKTKEKVNIIFFSLAFLLGLSLFLLERHIPSYYQNPSFMQMVWAGFIYAFGKIVPGVSGASLLMLIGVYEYFLNIIAHPFSLNITIFLHLIPFILSFIISAFLLLKIIKYLLNHYFRLTYSAIIGFVISSVTFLIPAIPTFKSILIVFLAFLIAYEISK